MDGRTKKPLREKPGCRAAHSYSYKVETLLRRSNNDEYDGICHGYRNDLDDVPGRILYTEHSVIKHRQSSETSCALVTREHLFLQNDYMFSEGIEG